jgi:5-methyltetrahydrofolate--homocysteine methyltransferase
MDIENKTGITLTDSLAMLPAASVSGLLFSHKESKYFSVGKIAEDQIIDYSERKNQTQANTEKYLSSIIGFK